MDRKLKVLFYVFFPGGGIGKYSHEVLSAMHTLRSDNADARVICMPTYEWCESAEYPVQSSLMAISHRRPVLRKLRFLVAQWVNPVRLCQAAFRWKPDWIHFSNVNPLTYPFWRLLLKATKAKVAITAHDVRRQKGILNLRWEHMQLKRMYQDAALLFVHGEEQAADLIEFANVPERKIRIVPMGPFSYPTPASGNRQELRRKYQIDGDRRVVLFFGFIRDEKQLDRLIQALAQAENTGWHLLIAGNAGAAGHKPISYYQEQIAQLGVGNRVTFEARYIPDEEIPDLFRVADCLALPYSKRFTSQSAVLNVATQFQVPVIATPCPMFAEILAAFKIGILCEDDGQQGIADGLVAMSGALEQKEPFAFGCYESEFSWRRNAELTVKAYQSEVAECQVS